ncbi:MAG: ABC transporter ATP-binding protein [Bacteroidota bacterium]
MITIKDLEFGYSKGQNVLNGVSLCFESGNIYGLFGKNGEGKTSLMKIMSGLLYPKRGVYTLDGMSVFARKAHWLQHLFLVPEDFELPSIPISSYQNINAPFYSNFSKSQFQELIQEFGLLPHLNIGTLSFGQRKKVLIAFALSTNTQFLFMDEPTNGLDIPSKSQFRRVMASVATNNKCIIISTHQVRDLYSLINHVMVLDHAKVVFDQSLAAVADKLWFGKANNERREGALFSETGLGGKSILPKKGLEETEVDLELLFQGILSAPHQINAILKAGSYGI